VSPAYVSGDTDGDNKLDLGETWIFEASGTSVTGNYTNTGTAEGSFEDSAGHTRTDTETDDSSYFGANPQIDIDKVTNGTDGGTYVVGSTITWTFTVTNTGNVALSDVSVTDDKLGVICGFGNLGVGDSGTCEATGTATAGAYANTGTATGSFTDDAGNTTSATATDDSSYFGAAPSISIDKVTVDGATADDGLNILTGESIQWRFVVTNTGNVTLTNVSVTDDVLGAICGISSLAVGDSATCTVSGTAITGAYTNTGTATGTFTDDADVTTSVTASDGSSYSGANPQIDIDKVTVDGATADDGLNILTGESITWRYTVTNVGNVALSNVSVTDSKPGVSPSYVSGDTDADGRLDLNETWIYEASGTAVTGSYSNTGTASGSFTDSAGHTRTDTDTDASSYSGADPQIDIDKVTVWGSTSGDGILAIAGDPITWRYTITNVGNVALSNVSVTDNKPGVSPTYVSGDTDADGKLDLGETWIFEATGTAIEQSYSNVGTTSGTYTDSNGHSRADTETDASSYFGIRRNQPSIAINSLTASVVPNTSRKTVTGTFGITDESEGGNQPDGFLIALDEYQVDWEYAKKSTFETSDYVNNSLKINGQTVTYACTYRVLAIDGDTSVAHNLAPGEVVVFDERVDMGYTCTFSKSLPTSGTLRGTVRAGIFNRDMTFLFRNSFRLGSTGM
jgi:uncharacterized repeat protein (TIGR01451 family)